MKRRTWPAAVALVTSIAVLLTACGNDESSGKGNREVAGAETGAADKSPSPSASTSVERPAITLPSDVADVFENWKTGDAAKDAVLADAARAQTAMNDAIVKGRVDAPGLTFYYKGEGLTSSVKWVQKWLDAGITYTGTTRYFNPKIEVFAGKSAGVSFCADESKAYNKDRKAGKIDKTPPTDDSYVLYNTRLEKDERGVWQTSSGTSVRGSKACAQ